MKSKLVHWLSESFIRAYLDDCEDKGLRPKTTEWYGYHLRRARNWLESEPRCHALGILDARQMANYYRSTRNLAINTRRHMVSALRAFGTWLQRHGIEENPASNLQRPREEKKLPEILPPSQVTKLLQALDEEPLRERTLVYLLVDGGLRRGELARLRRGHLDLAVGKVTVYDGKGSKDREVFVGRPTADLLGALLDQNAQTLVDQNAPLNDGVFLSEYRPHQPIGGDGVRHALNRLAKRHNFDRLKPHVLRRTHGTELRAAGVGLDLIGDQLGHEDLATTRKYYARLDADRRQSLVQAASPVEHYLREIPIPMPDWPMPGNLST